MEKFMLIFRGSDVYQPGQSPEALETLKIKMMDWVGDLFDKGIHISSEILQPTGIQISGAKKVVVDAPFGEAKEIIGGCTIVQAIDILDAIQIAKSCPILETNANIEVRPYQVLEK